MKNSSLHFSKSGDRGGHSSSASSSLLEVTGLEVKVPVF